MTDPYPLQVFHAPCDCYSHEIRASFDFADDREVCLSVWSHGNGSDHWGWKEKLRSIFWILRKGHPYGDQVMLKPDKARGLAKALLEMADRADGVINVSQEQKAVVK